MQSSRRPCLLNEHTLDPEACLPQGAFSVLPCSREGADLFTTDPRFKLLSFTGSPAVSPPPISLFSPLCKPVIGSALPVLHDGIPG